MQTTSVTFDLLELSWWQNPWYYAALALAIGILLCAGIAWYYWHRRVLTAEEKIIEHLKDLYTLPRLTHAEQKQIYASLTRLIKEFAALAVRKPAGYLLALTDEELGNFIQNVDAPQNFITTSHKILNTARAIKFAEHHIAPEEVELQIAELHAVLTTIVEAKNKKA